MMEVAGVTEELKACDPMRWVGLMNTLKAQAEEVIFQELIFSKNHVCVLHTKNFIVLETALQIC